MIYSLIYFNWYNKNIDALRALTENLISYDDISISINDTEYELKHILSYLKFRPSNKLRPSKKDTDLINYLEQDLKIQHKTINLTEDMREDLKDIFKHDNFSEGLCNYTLAILQKPDNNNLYEKNIRENYFNKAISYLKLSLSNKEDVAHTLKTLNKINCCYRSEDSKSLEQLIKKTISHKNPQPLDKNLVAMIYTSIIQTNLFDANYDYALELAKSAYEFYKKTPTISQNSKLEIVYNLALCYFKLTDTKKALEYYKEAESLSIAIDEDIVHDKFLIFLHQNNFLAADLEVQKFKGTEKFQIYTQKLLLAKQKANGAELKDIPMPLITNESLKELLDKESPNLELECYLELLLHNNSKLFLESYEHVLNRQTSLLKKENDLMQFIQSCVYNNKLLNECLTLHDIIYTKFPYLKNHNNTFLHYYECILFLNNDMQSNFFDKLNILKKDKFTYSLEKVNLLIQSCEKVYIDKKISDGNYTEAKTYLENSTLSHSQKITYLAAIKTLEDLAYEASQSKEAKESSHSLSSNSLKSEESANITKISDTEEIASSESIATKNSVIRITDQTPIETKKRSIEETNALIELEFATEEADFLGFTAKEIHTYFQSKKLRSLEEITTPRNTAKWSYNGTNYSAESEDVQALNDNGQYYCTIDSKLWDKLETIQQQQFLSALGKGQASASHGQNGVKTINHSVIELKINEDIRLYTKTIYKNESNKHLIIFNKKGTHDEIAKAANNSKLEIISTTYNATISAEKESDDISNGGGGGGTFFHDNDTPDDSIPEENPTTDLSGNIDPAAENLS